MLEIICAGSLAWSINVCQGRESFDFASPEKVKISNVIQQDITSNRRIAKGKPYESEYRRDADRDRDRELNEIRQDRDRDRIYRDADCYRRESEYDDEDRDRIYRDADCYRQEDEYDDDDQDRIYRDAEQRRRSEGEYIQPESSIDYRQDRSRIDYRRARYYRR